mgnify:FL=1
MKSQKCVLQNFQGRIFNSSETTRDKRYQEQYEFDLSLGIKRQLLYRNDECLGEPLF